MKRRSLLLVVALLCLASLMAAMAYSTAIVTNAASMTVENTTGSLLGLTVNNGVGNKDNAAWIEEGKLHFDFAKGIGNHESGWVPRNWGIQPGSTYTWDELFNVSNNSLDNVVYRIDASDELLPYITVTAVKAAGAGINVPFVENGINNTNGLGLAKGDTGSIKVSFIIPEDFEGDLASVFNGTLTVKARADETIFRHNPVIY